MNRKKVETIIEEIRQEFNPDTAVEKVAFMAWAEKVRAASNRNPGVLIHSFEESEAALSKEIMRAQLEREFGRLLERHALLKQKGAEVQLIRELAERSGVFVKYDGNDYQVNLAKQGVYSQQAGHALREIVDIAIQVSETMLKPEELSQELRIFGTILESYIEMNGDSARELVKQVTTDYLIAVDTAACADTPPPLRYLAEIVIKSGYVSKQ